MFKTALLKYLKKSIDLNVASSLHGIKIIAGKENNNIVEATFHACASHHIDHKNARQAPL